MKSGMVTDRKYLTCPHLSRSVIHSAVELLGRCSKTTVSHICAECEFSGSLNEQAFRQHFGASKHKFCLRVSPSIELFCFQCGDYEFCSYLDRLTGRKRDLSILSKRSYDLTGATSTKHSKINARGLVNMGATCFMNSVVQILSRNQFITNCAQFCLHPEHCTISKARKTDGDAAMSVDSFNSIEQSITSCIPCEFKTVSDSLCCGDDEDPIVPSNLLFAMWNFVNYMAGYSQQDAHEFLIAFLNSIDSQLRVNEFVNDGSFSKLYTGEVQSCLTCMQCRHVSIKKETFVDLSLSIDIEKTNIDDDSPEELSILDCLEYFTTIENLSERMFCDVCRTDQEKTKQLSIVDPPNVLMFQLKRFDFLTQRKLTKAVRFPLQNLDLGLFASDEAESEALYNLHGVVCHQGSLHQGHYTSYVLEQSDPNDVYWLRCDDDKVSWVSENEVQNAEAYLLFYSRNVLIDEN